MRTIAPGESAPGVPAGLEVGLRNYWYPVWLSDELGADAPVAARALGEDLVLWRDGQGQPRLLVDRCPHRVAKLSLGRVLGDHLQCAYHGLRFDGRGTCVLVPWEPEDRAAPPEMTCATYPVQEMGGLIWAYLGDVARFPPPPLADVVPPEALDDGFTRYTMTEVWHTNWLLALDGTDRYHAQTLHATTQAVANEPWEGGAARPAAVPLADRRLRLVDTPEGMRAFSVDRDGRPIHTGHVLATGFPYFQLPCLITNVFVATPGAEPYRNRLWLFPLDAEHTRATRLIGQPTPTAEARAHWARFYEAVAKPRTLAVSAEDARMCESQGTLAEARAHEHLLRPDADVHRMRQQIRTAFLLQQQGKRYAPEGATAEGVGVGTGAEESR